MVRQKRTLLFLFIFSQHAGAIPVVNPKSDCPNFDYNDVAGPEPCFLTPKLGGRGIRSFLEECAGLGKLKSGCCKSRPVNITLTSIYSERFTTVPKPLTDTSNAFGVHPVVCCPEPLPDSAICFPSDPWCKTFVAPEVNYNYDYEGCQESQEILGGENEEDYPGDVEYQDQGDTEVNYDYEAFESPSPATVCMRY